MNFDHIFLLLKARFVAERTSQQSSLGHWGVILRFVAEQNCGHHIYAAILFGHEPEFGHVNVCYGNISGANFGQFRWFWFDFCRCAVRNKLRPQAPATNKLRPQSVISNCHDSKCNDLKKKNKCSLPCSPLLQAAYN